MQQVTRQVDSRRKPVVVVACEAMRRQLHCHSSSPNRIPGLGFRLGPNSVHRHRQRSPVDRGGRRKGTPASSHSSVSGLYRAVESLKRSHQDAVDIHHSAAAAGVRTPSRQESSVVAGGAAPARQSGSRSSRRPDPLSSQPAWPSAALEAVCLAPLTVDFRGLLHSRIPSLF